MNSNKTSQLQYKNGIENIKQEKLQLFSIHLQNFTGTKKYLIDLKK